MEIGSHTNIAENYEYHLLYGTVIALNFVIKVQENIWTYNERGHVS